MISPLWHQRYFAKGKSLPGSQKAGHAVAQLELAPLQAQIAVFFGQPEGSLNDLQQGVSKLVKGEPVICSACDRNIFTELHKSDCSIAAHYKEIKANQPTDFWA